MHTFPHFSPFGGGETKLEIGYLALPRREGGGGGGERGKKKIHTSGKGRRRRRLNPFYPFCGLQGPHKKKLLNGSLPDLSLSFLSSSSSGGDRSSCGMGRRRGGVSLKEESRPSHLSLAPFFHVIGFSLLRRPPPPRGASQGPAYEHSSPFDYETSTDTAQNMKKAGKTYNKFQQDGAGESKTSSSDFAARENKEGKAESFVLRPLQTCWAF